MAQIVVTVIQTSPVDLVLLKHVLIAVIASCDSSFGSHLLDVKRACSLMRVEAVTLRAVDSNALLELLSFVLFILN